MQVQMRGGDAAHAQWGRSGIAVVLEMQAEESAVRAERGLRDVCHSAA